MPELSKGRSLVKPNPDAPRLLAWEVFRSVQRGESYSHIRLPQALLTSHLDARDKGFVSELVYGALRMQGHADFVLSRLSARPVDEIDEDLHDFLRFALYQVLHMRIPAHAVVSANVELARKVIGESKGSFVNAILRKATLKSLSEWLQEIDLNLHEDEVLAIKTSHPQWIVSAYRDQLKDVDEVERALLANNVAARPTLCVWPGEITRDELMGEGGELTHYSPYGVVATKPPMEYSAVRQRRVGVQDEGSQLVADIFFRSLGNPQSILDACAGPGGKAALLSRLSQGIGANFVANEISPARADLIRQVVPYGTITHHDAREITEEFDAVLADVPCTGIGALRRRPEVRWRRLPSDIKNLMPLQIDIAQRAFDNLAPGGILGYSTCSPHIMETRAVVETLLRKNPDSQEIAIEVGIEGANNGKSMQLWTHRHQMDSMFLALIRKGNRR